MSDWLPAPVLPGGIFLDQTLPFIRRHPEGTGIAGRLVSLFG